MKFSHMTLKHHHVSMIIIQHSRRKKREEKEGFEEAISSSDDGKTKAFFNLGRNNDYKKLLKKETIKSIEELFGEEMKELGYL